MGLTATARRRSAPKAARALPGGAWQPTPQSIDANANEFNSVWGTSSRPAVGGRVTTGGSSCGSTVPPRLSCLRQNQSLYGVFGRSESDIFAVGSSFGGFSLILHGQP